MFVQTKVELLERMLRAAGSEQTRYYLTGVHIRSHAEGGCVVESSNGHIAAMYYDVDGETNDTGDVRGIVAPKAIAEIVKAAKVWAKDARINYSDVRAKVFENGYTFFTDATKETGGTRVIGLSGIDPKCFIDGSFPDVSAILKLLKVKPGLEAKHTAPIDPHKFAQLASTFSDKPIRNKVNQSGYAFRIFETDETSALIIRGESDEWLGLLMPMQDKLAPKSALPEWAQCKPVSEINSHKAAA
jgi:hypothetical protein